jgi:hypothetical protein
LLRVAISERNYLKFMQNFDLNKTTKGHYLCAASTDISLRISVIVVEIRYNRCCPAQQWLNEAYETVWQYYSELSSVNHIP